jgi:hypothetical protein
VVVVMEEQLVFQVIMEQLTQAVAVVALVVVELLAARAAAAL